MIPNRPVPRDVALGVAGAALGLVFIAGAMAITPDPSAFKVLGPRVAPLVIGTATVVISVALVVQALRIGSRPEAPSALPGDPAGQGHPAGQAGPASPALAGTSDEDGSADSPPSRRRLLVTFGLLTGYALVFIPLGYIVSTFAFLTALTTYTEPAKWRRNVLFAAVFSVVVYLLFTRGLQVQLPPGLLG
jgi:putative tricarboxylic transport membrane protein